MKFDESYGWKKEQPYPMGADVGVLLKDKEGKLKKQIQDAKKSGKRIYIVQK